MLSVTSPEFWIQCASLFVLLLTCLAIYQFIQKVKLPTEFFYYSGIVALSVGALVAAIVFVLFL